MNFRVLIAAGALLAIPSLAQAQMGSAQDEYFRKVQEIEARAQQQQIENRIDQLERQRVMDILTQPDPVPPPRHIDQFSAPPGYR